MDSLSDYPTPQEINHSTEIERITTVIEAPENEKPEFLLRPNAIDKWVSKVRKDADNTFDLIIHNAQSVFDAETELVKDFDEGARDEFRELTGLSQSMLSKLKNVGEIAAKFVAHKATLPPSLTTLYLLSKLDDTTMGLMFKDNLKDKTRVEVEEMIFALTGSTSGQIQNVGAQSKNERSVRNLISFTVEKTIGDEMLIPIINEIKAAVGTLSVKHHIPVSVANVAVDEERKAKVMEKDKQRKEKTIVKRIKKEVRDKFKQLHWERANAQVKRKQINLEFYNRFGEQYREAITHPNPLYVYEKGEAANWISAPDREVYERIVPKPVDETPIAAGRSKPVIGPVESLFE